MGLPKVLKRVWIRYMPLAESLALVSWKDQVWSFTNPAAETARLIEQVCPAVKEPV